MPYLIFIVLFVLVNVCSPVEAKVYKWVDQDGKTHFTEQAPADVESEEILNPSEKEEKKIETKKEEKAEPEKEAEQAVTGYVKTGNSVRKKVEILDHSNASDITSGILYPAKDACGFNDWHMPEDLVVFAGGASRGRKTNQAIDKSRYPAGEFTVTVDSPGKPVALILTASDSSIWNIDWTDGTRIVAIVANGLHRQIVRGAPPNTNIIISTYANKGACGYTSLYDSGLLKLNDYSRKIFRKKIDMLYFADEGKLAFSGKDKPFPPEDISQAEIKLNYFLSEPEYETINHMLSDGSLRKLTREDVERWAVLKALVHRREFPPMANKSLASFFLPEHMPNGYVIQSKVYFLKEMKVAEKLTLFLPEGVPAPGGELKPLQLFDFNTMTRKDY